MTLQNPEPGEYQVSIRGDYFAITTSSHYPGMADYDADETSLGMTPTTKMVLALGSALESIHDEPVRLECLLCKLIRDHLPQPALRGFLGKEYKALHRAAQGVLDAWEKFDASITEKVQHNGNRDC